MVTGHGKTRSYLYRFRIIEEETCTCKKGPQTVSHLLLECDILTTARSCLKMHITTKGDNWPVSNDKLTTTYLKKFLQFVKSINFDLLCKNTAKKCEIYVFKAMQTMYYYSIVIETSVNQYVKSNVKYMVLLYRNGAFCLKKGGGE
jgi:hypothetical protein